MHLVIGSIPRSFRWILSILGYQGSVEQGLEELRLAAERSSVESNGYSNYMSSILEVCCWRICMVLLY